MPKEEADRLRFSRRKQDRVTVLLQNAKSRARIHGAVFSLSPAEIERLRRVWDVGVCEVSGVAFDRDGVGGPLVPSLDRKDSSYGYLDGNVRLVVWAANRMMAGRGEAAVAPVIQGWAAKLRGAE